jgi:hypothetical protein
VQTRVRLVENDDGGIGDVALLALNQLSDTAGGAEQLKVRDGIEPTETRLPSRTHRMLSSVKSVVSICQAERSAICATGAPGAYTRQLTSSMRRKAAARPWRGNRRGQRASLKYLSVRLLKTSQSFQKGRHVSSQIRYTIAAFLDNQRGYVECSNMLTDFIEACRRELKGANRITDVRIKPG